MIAIPPPALAPTATPVALPATAGTAPTEADATRFQAALSRPQVTIGSLDSIAPTAPDPVVTTPSALGDRVLASVERMRVNFKEGLARMDTTMHKEDFRLPDVMRVFVDTMQLSLQQDMLSKMVGSTTQNLNTLLKGQ